MNIFLTTTLILVCFIIVSISFIRLCHPDYSVTECARLLRATAYATLVGLFGSSTRHTFDEHLETGFLKIISPYRNMAFEPTLKVSFINQAPCIVISFVSNEILPEDELSKISRLIRLKFSHYLAGYNKAWHYFTVYHMTDNLVKLYLFYSELSEDKEPFFKRYRQEVRQKSTPNHGVLRDEALDRELRRGHY